MKEEEKIEYIKFRDYYSMSTKKAQSIVNGKATRTREGFSKPVKIEYPVSGLIICNHIWEVLRVILIREI